MIFPRFAKTNNGIETIASRYTPEIITAERAYDNAFIN
jgi:hypothetical protein